MPENPTKSENTTDELGLLIDGFELSLHATNKSAKTVIAYIGACELFAAFLRDQGMPREVAHIKREHVEAFIVSLLERWKPATANNRYRGLQAFFKWCIEEGEITESPMRNMKPPAVPVDPPDVLSIEDLKRILDGCRGEGYENIRDMALLRIFMTTGGRLSEIANLQLSDVVITRTEQYLEVLGKGRKRRRLPLDNRTSRALNRYLRERRKRKAAQGSDALWIGNQGGMTDSGIARVVRRRSEAAGVGRIHPHRFRHTFSHHFLAGGGQEHDLMSLNGWTSPQMVARYGAALASQRAHEAHKRVGLGDRL